MRAAVLIAYHLPAFMLALCGGGSSPGGELSHAIPSLGGLSALQQDALSSGTSPKLRQSSGLSGIDLVTGGAWVSRPAVTPRRPPHLRSGDAADKRRSKGCDGEVGYGRGMR